MSAEVIGMVVKKAGGKIYGAVLTSAEKKAMNMEIERQLAEYTRKHEVELNAMILYVLHEQLGFGEQRLRKFFDRFSVEIDALVKYYEMDDEDAEWLCTRKLLDMGIDALKKEIQNYVKKNTAPYKYPRIVEFREDLPKTISGKIRRVELKG